MSKLEELKAAFEAATPEDWTLFGGAVCKGRSTITIAQCYQTAVEDEWKRNSEFIALAHNLMPQLLDAVEALQTIANSEEFHGDSFVCDFETLQSVARAALVKGEQS